jgi:hypothetical protein
LHVARIGQRENAYTGIALYSVVACVTHNVLGIRYDDDVGPYLLYQLGCDEAAQAGFSPTTVVRYSSRR